ncbi:transmembrane protein 26-like [Actinia tenebrosa]|uniref:Transmembrane protein 26-like n=1 Tax=Actinia tenebrosa TaxID=6105 RepID=A0A6P8H7B7_ACTTE|nr:transmembrane protein 26-like [Actinia tenebrosa]
MIIEMLYVMIKRKGREYSLFWPSCFLYLSAIIPVIWVLELDLLQHRLDERDQLTDVNDSKRIILSQTSFGKYILNASIDTEVAAKKVCELGVLLLIIFGRWLLPRGKLTRDQLSNLLLAYIGLGADILDLFEPLTHPNVKHNVILTYSTLGLFTWSMLQFCLIAMATAGSDDVSEASCQQKMEKKTAKDIAYLESGQPKNEPNKRPDDVESISSASSVHEKQSDDESVASTEGSIATHGSNEPQDKDPYDHPKTTPSIMSADLVSILCSLLMHDGPFLVFRLVLVGMYQVTSEIHLFFTAKNVLTVVIMLYRLYHLHVSRVATVDQGDQDRRRNSKTAAA